MPNNDKPSPKQQAYLRSLAQKTGTTFTPPKTRSEARREIDRLKALTTSPRHERHTDRQAVQQAQRGGATHVRDEEVEGYGSNCQWSPGKTRPGS